MSYKKTEWLLYNYKKLKAEIKNIKIEIHELEDAYIGISAIDTSQEFTGTTNKITSMVENEIVNKEKRIEYLESIKKSKENKVKRIDNALDILTERERKIIELRYFERVPNYVVAKRLNITEETCSTLKRKIVKNIKKILIID